jgi:tetratricopeptide (TPR) repeat protein
VAARDRKVSHATYGLSLGRLDGAEEQCRAGLAELRALGEQWGIAMALTQLAEFAELRADHAASIAAITEAVAVGREIGVWGDLTYVEGRLAVVHARAGDLDRGYAEIARVRRSIEARGGRVDTDRWVAFMLAELASLKGDYAEAARCCETVLTLIAPNEARWWQSLRAQVKARLAIAVLRQGDTGRCLSLLTESLEATAAWQEHPALASVLDACAVCTLTRNGPGAPEQAARVLGAAHAIRGAFDESSLDAPSAREKARQALGPGAFAAAYESARTSTYEAALALPCAALA